MIITFVITSLSILLGILYFLKLVFKGKHVPKDLKDLPTIRGWPLFGLLFSLKKPLFVYLLQLKKEHGDIFRFTVGCRDMIVLNTSSVINKALKEDGNNFSGRWKDIEVMNTLHNTGIIFQDKEIWEIQRSFIIKVLRDFGLGKQRSNEIVNYECAILMKELEENCGKVVSGGFIFPKYVVNVIAKLVMNMRFERTNIKFQSLTKIVENLTLNDSAIEFVLLMYPILEKMPRFSNFLLRCFKRSQLISEVETYIGDIIIEHEKKFNSEIDEEDLIDMFLKEKEKLNTSGVKDHSFTEQQLITVTMELFIAGYETTSTTLSWSMLLLSKHQEIQEKVYQEIVHVIGLDRPPKLLDKKMLVYTQAVMDEIFRISSVVPLSIPHRVFNNTQINGYFIPKDSVILPNIYAVHHDKDTWLKPFEFYPEHFLTNLDGIMTYRHREDLMPFGIGKRRCLGESLARLEFFIFLTSILQRFRVKLPDDITDEIFNKMTLGTDGLIRAPKNTDIIFELR